MTGGLTGAQRALVRLSAALGTGGRDAWRAALSAAKDRATADEIEEAILQAHLFAGFPVTLNALILWREMGRPAADAGRETGPDRWRDDGDVLCRRVYGGAYERLRENVRALHPDLDRWMVETGYGRTLSRPGLDAVSRELCVVGILAVGPHLRQLESHLWGALNVGASPEAVDEAIETVGTEEAKRVWAEVRARAVPEAT